MVFWAKHLQMDPTKGFWGPPKFSYRLPPPTIVAHRNVKSFCRSNKKDLVALISIYYDVSSMDTPRIYQEDLFSQSKAL